MAKKTLWVTLAYVDGDIQILGIFTDRARAKKLARDVNRMIRKLGKEDDENAFVEAADPVNTPREARLGHDDDSIYGEGGLDWWEVV